MTIFFGPSVVLYAALIPMMGSAPDSKESIEQNAEIKITLRLNTLHTKQVLMQFENLLQRETDLQTSLRALDTTDGRIAEYQKLLQDAQTDLQTIKKKLIALEVENAKLAKQLPKRDQEEETPKPAERSDRLLEKILQRLERIEKRLEKMERRP